MARQNVLQLLINLIEKIPMILLWIFDIISHRSPRVPPKSHKLEYAYTVLVGGGVLASILYMLADQANETQKHLSKLPQTPPVISVRNAVTILATESKSPSTLPPNTSNKGARTTQRTHNRSSVYVYYFSGIYSFQRIQLGRCTLFLFGDEHDAKICEDKKYKTSLLNFIDYISTKSTIDVYLEDSSEGHRYRHINRKNANLTHVKAAKALTPCFNESKIHGLCKLTYPTNVRVFGTDIRHNYPDLWNLINNIKKNNIISEETYQSVLDLMKILKQEVHKVVSNLQGSKPAIYKVVISKIDVDFKGFAKDFETHYKNNTRYYGNASVLLFRQTLEGLGIKTTDYVTLTRLLLTDRNNIVVYWGFVHTDNISDILKYIHKKLNIRNWVFDPKVISNVQNDQRRCMYINKDIAFT